MSPPLKTLGDDRLSASFSAAYSKYSDVIDG